MSAQLGDTSRFVVGDWIATPTRHLLECRERSVRLEPRPMQVLVYLAGRAGKVVSAEELVSSVWQGQIVGDGSVYQAINQLRQALGDRPHDARFIQTIPKQGYRLIAHVRVLEPESAEPAALYATGGRKLGFAATAGLVLVFAMVAFQCADQSRLPATLGDRSSVTILPLENLAAKPEDAWLAALVEKYSR